jgi:two-component system sensor histidine kinase CpxA
MAVILTGILVTIFGYFYHFIPENRHMLRIGREILEENGQLVVNAYESQGVQSAINLSSPGMLWLFDENLNNLFKDHQQALRKRKKFGGPPREHPADKRPEPVHDLLQFRESEIKDFAGLFFAGKAPAEPKELGPEQLIGCLITSATGKKYVIINQIPSKMTRHPGFLINRLLETMFIFLLVTALFCFALSRYMVKPITELKEASKRFAGGNLGARAGNGAEKRNDEIGDLAVDFNDMADKIESMIRSQRRLFGDISHELRSPLARLQVTVELLQNKLNDSEKPMLARIEKEIKRMNSLIEEVLNFSRLDSGSYEGEKINIALAELLNKICQDADFEGKSKNCRVILEIHDQPQIMAIPVLIERAIENILRNALKYSPENSIITVSLQKNADAALIRISDQGPGVPEAEIPKLFAPFYRCQEDRDRKTGGTGLGLAIAHRAIRLHQGQIILKNKAEGGLLAEVSIPDNSHKQAVSNQNQAPRC